MNTTGNKQVSMVHQIECDEYWLDVDINYYTDHDGSAKRIVYISPPATVPVEALEGLVAELTEEMSIDANGSDAYAFCVKRLTTLIKERSNG